MRQIKADFRKNVACRIALQGALTRNSIYSRNATDSQKREFRASLEKHLEQTLEQILSKKNYKDSDHNKTLSIFKAKIEKKHSNILKGKRLTIGTSQKLVNLYWKMLWVFDDKMNAPIHCPFDRIIINKFPKNARKNWTTLKTVEEYRDLVKEVKIIAAAAGVSIADWELQIYSEALKKNKVMI